MKNKKINYKNAMKNSFKQSAIFIGAMQKENNFYIELKIKDKNYFFRPLEDRTIRELKDLKLNYFDIVYFLGTKRSRIITHFLSKQEAEQLALF